MTTDARNVPINGDILTWAIEDGCVDRAALSARIGVQTTILTMFEEGTMLPTRDEWRALSEALRRPSAIFFLHERPSRETRTHYDRFHDKMIEAFDDLIQLAVSVGNASRLAVSQGASDD